MGSGSGGLTNMTTVTSSLWTGITDLLAVIAANPLLLIAVAGTFAALVIGLTMKLMGTRRRGRRRR